MDYKRMGLIGQDHPWSKQVPNFVKETSIVDRLFIRFNEDCLALLTHALLIVSKAEVTDELMNKALQRMVKMIPDLRLCIRNYIPAEGEKPIPVFVEMTNPKIDLEVSQSSDWKEEISKEWEKNFDTYNGPLWRVKLLPNVILNKKDEHFPYECVVIFCCSHISFDGKSYQMLFDHLLDSLDAEHNNSAPGSPTQVFPGVDHYLGEEDSFLDKLGSFVVNKMIHFQAGRSILMKLGGLGGKNPYMLKMKLPIDEDPTIPIQCKVFPVEFTKAETKQLTEACKYNGATVTGVLQIAASMAFATMMQGGTLSSAMWISTCCTADLRRVIGDKIKGALGNFAGSFVTNFEIAPYLLHDKQRFWESAKACSRQINQAVQEKNYLKLWKALKLMIPATEGTEYNLKDFVSERYGREAYPLLITNMGKTDFLSRGNSATFKLVGRFGGGSEQNGGNIIMHNINTFNDQMFMTLIYCPHIIKQEVVQKHADMIKSIIKNHCTATSE